MEQSILDITRAFNQLGLALLIAILSPIGAIIGLEIYKAMRALYR